MASLLKTRTDSVEELLHSDVIEKPEMDSIHILESLRETENDLHNLYKEIEFSGNPESYEEELDDKLSSIERVYDNLTQAYYRTMTIKRELSARRKGRVKRSGTSSGISANSLIEYEENRVNHFAKGINIYKILLIGYLGSFIGVIVEMLWCLLQRNRIESRAGLIYGPFNLLYGVGAIVLTLVLYRFRNKDKWIAFLGGFIIGCILEYLCSWGQELIFGTQSWDYSKKILNINGRICLVYNLVWGFMGIWWIKSVYPWLSGLILKIPQKVGKTLTWILLAFFIFNGAVTAVSVWRWSGRVNEVKAESSFWEFIDKKFPNERMEKIFENMSFKSK